VPRALEASVITAVVGVVHPLTVAICALTIVFAAAALAAMVVAVRWARRPDRPALAHRLSPTACAVAAFGVALWFAANGIIGLRTWAW
jgi:hypothetical protein